MGKHVARIRGIAAFSLIEVMIVISIMMIAMYGMSTMTINLGKTQKRIDIKSQAMNLSSTIRYSMLTPASCEKAFLIDANATIPTGISPPLFDTTALTASTETTPYQYVSSAQTEPFALQIGGTVIKPGAVFDGIKVRDLILVLPPGLTYPDKRVAKLLITFEPAFNNSGPTNNTATSLGTQIVTETVIIPMTTEASQSQTGKSVIKTCSANAGGTDDPETLCNLLKGTWLKSSAQPPFLTDERCNMTRDIDLGMDEYPDGMPNGKTQVTHPNGTASWYGPKGERVSYCYYTKSGSTVIYTYTCSNRYGTLPGNRCWYDTQARAWKVSYFDSTGTPTTLRHTCTKGVRLTATSPGISTLDWYEAITPTTFGSTPTGWATTQAVTLSDRSTTITYEQKQDLAKDLASGISRCQYVPDGDFWYMCGNTNSSTLVGQAPGSCIYVENIALSGQNNSDITTYNGAATCASGSTTNPPCIDDAKYTGWIYVKDDRTAALWKSNKTWNKESRGMPCFQVELNKQAALAHSTWSLNTEKTAAPASLPALHKVKQCLRYDPAYETALTSGSRIFQIECKNDTLPETPTEDDLVGTSTGDASKLESGTCAYVTSVALINQYPKTAAPRYTGWVYLKQNLPSDAGANTYFEKLAASNGLKYNPAVAVNKQPVLNAIPCNVGVRYEP